MSFINANSVSTSGTNIHLAFVCLFVVNPCNSLLTPPRRFCLCRRMSVREITRKVMNGFRDNVSRNTITCCFVFWNNLNPRILWQIQDTFAHHLLLVTCHKRRRKLPLEKHWISSIEYNFNYWTENDISVFPDVFFSRSRHLRM